MPRRTKAVSENQALELGALEAMMSPEEGLSRQPEPDPAPEGHDSPPGA